MTLLGNAYAVSLTDAASVKIGEPSAVTGLDISMALRRIGSISDLRYVTATSTWVMTPAPAVSVVGSALRFGDYVQKG